MGIYGGRAPGCPPDPVREAFEEAVELRRQATQYQLSYWDRWRLRHAPRQLAQAELEERAAAEKAEAAYQRWMRLRFVEETRAPHLVDHATGKILTRWPSGEEE